MRPEDLEKVLAMLRNAKLPLHGVAEGLHAFIVAESGGRIVGVAGLERYGRYGLLRSVAVARDWRGRGLGSSLTRKALDLASRERLAAVYLLTETAADYFPRHGFERIPRSEVADAVKASAEFREVCPEGAIAMVCSLAHPEG